MALNAGVLSGLIKAALLGNPASGAKDNEALEILCSAIAGAVVSHIQSAGAVAVTVVTTCGAGPGTGTGTGTVG